MKLFVAVKPGSKKDGVMRIDADHMTVRTTARAHDGEANAAAIRLLSQYLRIPQSRITILAGARSRQKIFAVS